MVQLYRTTCTRQTCSALRTQLLHALRCPFVSSPPGREALSIMSAPVSRDQAVRCKLRREAKRSSHTCCCCRCCCCCCSFPLRSSHTAAGCPLLPNLPQLRGAHGAYRGPRRRGPHMQGAGGTLQVAVSFTPSRFYALTAAPRSVAWSWRATQLRRRPSGAPLATRCVSAPGGGPVRRRLPQRL